MPRLFFESDDEGLVPLDDSAYENEAELQVLVEKYPELLLGDLASSANGVKYLHVRREAGVPGLEGGTDRWFVDHVFLDGEGVPTLVEVKRAADTRIRREVVGQMLDYAVNILAFWSSARMREEFEATCEAADPRVESVVKVREVSDADYEEYWQRVKANLAARRLRLIFLADEIPAELQSIVEFLNEQLRSTEVLAVQVRRHRRDEHTVLSAQVIGKSREASIVKDQSEEREWNVDLALEELRRGDSPAAVEVAEKLDAWGRERGLDYSWGSGTKIGYGSFVVRRDGSGAQPFGFSTDGKIDLYPKKMRLLRPFDEDELRVDFIRRVATAAGTRVDEEVAQQTFKSFKLERFAGEEACGALLAAFDWFIDQVEAAARAE